MATKSFTKELTFNTKTAQNLSHQNNASYKKFNIFIKICQMSKSITVSLNNENIELFLGCTILLTLFLCYVFCVLAKNIKLKVSTYGILFWNVDNSSKDNRFKCRDIT